MTKEPSPQQRDVGGSGETPDAEPARTSAEQRVHVAHSTRWLWVLIGAVMMGGIAFGAMYLGRYFVLQAGIFDTQVQFWVFEIGTGLGYLIGGFLVALLSPGQTLREPMFAAMLAFTAQTVLLLASEIIVELRPQWFFVMLAIDGGLAYFGAWVGEKVTGTA